MKFKKFKNKLLKIVRINNYIHDIFYLILEQIRFENIIINDNLYDMIHVLFNQIIYINFKKLPNTKYLLYDTNLLTNFKIYKENYTIKKIIRIVNLNNKFLKNKTGLKDNNDIFNFLIKQKSKVRDDFIKIDKQKPRVSLILYGKYFSDKNYNTENDNNIFKKHISLKLFKKYIKDIYDTDVFIHCWDDEYKNHIINELKPNNYIFENQIDFENTIIKKFNLKKNKDNSHYIKRFTKMYSHYYSRKLAIDLCLQYNKNYDFVILCQIQTLILNNINLLNLDPNKIYSPFFNYQIGGGKDHLTLEEINKIKLLNKKNKNNTISIQNKACQNNLLKKRKYYIYNFQNKNELYLVNLEKEENLLNKACQNNLFTQGSFKILPGYVLSDYFYISNLENIKIIGNCYEKLDIFFKKHYPLWDSTPGCHGMIFEHLVHENKQDKLYFYLYSHLDIIKAKDFINYNQLKYLHKKLNDKNYLNIKNKIYPIDYYLPFPKEYLNKELKM